MRMVIDGVMVEKRNGVWLINSNSVENNLNVVIPNFEMKPSGKGSRGNAYLNNPNSVANQVRNKFAKVGSVDEIRANSIHSIRTAFYQQGKKCRLIESLPNNVFKVKRVS